MKYILNLLVRQLKGYNFWIVTDVGDLSKEAYCLLEYKKPSRWPSWWRSLCTYQHIPYCGLVGLCHGGSRRGGNIRSTAYYLGDELLHNTWVGRKVESTRPDISGARHYLPRGRQNSSRTEAIAESLRAELIRLYTKTGFTIAYQHIKIRKLHRLVACL